MQHTVVDLTRFGKFRAARPGGTSRGEAARLADERILLSGVYAPGLCLKQA